MTFRARDVSYYLLSPPLGATEPCKLYEPGLSLLPREGYSTKIPDGRED
jgi:hypothetical protein